MAACALALRLPRQMRRCWLAFGVGLVLVAGIGWIDDHRPLSPWLRLGVHALAAAVLAAGDRGTPTATPWLAAVPRSSLAHGADQRLELHGRHQRPGRDARRRWWRLALACGGRWQPGRWLALALAAACLGFLPFNFPRARIFLGDVGSGALGFALAALLSWRAARPAADRWPLLLLPLSAFLVDAGLTLLTRMLRGERWWTAARPARLPGWARRSGAHAGVTLAYAGVDAACRLLA